MNTGIYRETGLLITYRQRLAELGLNVEVGYDRPWSPSHFGGVVCDVSFHFQCRDEEFSPELLSFLKSKIELMDDQIEGLKKISAHNSGQPC